MDEKIIFKHLLSLTRRAIDEYELVEKDEKLCVGLSGGKDSLTLLSLLATLQKFHPTKFSLEAVTISLGFSGINLDPLKKHCDSMGINLTVVETPIAEVVFNIRKESNPCSLCANMRRGAVNSAAKKLGCSSVALAHHKDDVIETVLMSLFYEGRMNCFTPKTWLDKKAIKVIRPLIYVRESEIKMYSELAGLPIIHNPCPMDKSSRRSEVKDLLLKMESKNKYLKANIFGAVKRSLWT